MNAGAEYVLYRIWATLQDSEGIHAESLFACLGALSGYACQVYVRQAGARGATDSGRYALTTITALDGTTYFQGDALNLPLAESPLSVWALVGRAVQKTGQPLPDIGGIFSHVTHTAGTSAFGMPRVPYEHRPRHRAIVYLRHLWPQILPIARRFCRKPAQLPVLFGIALQRAIEHTTSLLNPTLSASIAMECAVAMSRVALPELTAEVVPTSAPVPQIVLSPKPILTLPTGLRADPVPARARRSTNKRRTPGVDANALAASSFAARLPATKIFATIASLALIAIGSAMWRADQAGAAGRPGFRSAPAAIPRIERKLRVSAFQRDDSRPIAQPIEDTRQLDPEPSPIETPPPAIAEEPEAPATPPEQPANEGIITDEP